MNGVLSLDLSVAGDQPPEPLPERAQRAAVPGQPGIESSAQEHGPHNVKTGRPLSFFFHRLCIELESNDELSIHDCDCVSFFRNIHHSSTISVPPSRWITFPSIVNAYYSFKFNSISKSRPFVSHWNEPHLMHWCALSRSSYWPSWQPSRPPSCSRRSSVKDASRELLSAIEKRCYETEIESNFFLNLLFFASSYIGETGGWYPFTSSVNREMLFYWLTRNWINGFLSEHELTNGYWSQSHELRSHWSRHRSRNHPRIRRPGYSSQTRLRPVNIPSPVMCHARTFALPRKKTKFPLPEVDSDSENAPRIRPRSSSPTSALEMRPPFGDWPMLGCCLFFFLHCRTPERQRRQDDDVVVERRHAVPVLAAGPVLRRSIQQLFPGRRRRRRPDSSKKIISIFFLWTSDQRWPNSTNTFDPSFFWIHFQFQEIRE